MVELWVVFVVRVLVGACLRDIVIKITIHFGVEEIAEPGLQGHFDLCPRISPEKFLISRAAPPGDKARRNIRGPRRLQNATTDPVVQCATDAAATLCPYDSPRRGSRSHGVGA